MTRPLAVLAFLLIAFTFVELWLLYGKLTKLERRVNLADREIFKLRMAAPPPKLDVPMMNINPLPMKRKPAAKRRRKP